MILKNLNNSFINLKYQGLIYINDGLFSDNSSLYYNIILLNQPLIYFNNINEINLYNITINTITIYNEIYYN